jgi:endoglucanase
MKKSLLFFIFLLSFTTLNCKTKLNQTKLKTLYSAEYTVQDTGKAAIKDITAKELASKMGTGWNLGNTLDATGAAGMRSETSWGCPKVTKKMISDLAKSGIKTIRIPVSWSIHMMDNNYTIEPEWMKRVKEIVDWSIEEGLYVVINSHHDNFPGPQNNRKPGYYPNSTNLTNSMNYIVNIWSQISLAFNNGYDEHLIFEAMNEPRLAGTTVEWSTDERNELCKDGFICIQKLNQAFVDVVRASGGNNKKRILIIPTLHAGADAALSTLFEMPSDVTPGKLMISVHMYTPYSFAMEMPGERTFTEKHQAEISGLFKKLYEKFSKNGYPVFIGEYGATNKDNDAERIKWFGYYLTEATKYGFIACVWDNHQFAGSKTQGERYGYYVREKGVWYSKDIHDVIIKSTK